MYPQIFFSTDPVRDLKLELLKVFWFKVHSLRHSPQLHRFLLKEHKLGQYERLYSKKEGQLATIIANFV